jgi:hypothetical protein
MASGNVNQIGTEFERTIVRLKEEDNPGKRVDFRVSVLKLTVQQLEGSHLSYRKCLVE